MAVTLKRGNTLRRALVARAGSTDGVVVTAVLKELPGDETPAAVFTVTPAASIELPDGTTLPGWVLELSAAKTLDLEAREYVTDARAVTATGVVVSTITERVVVDQLVTGPTDGA